MKTEQRRKTTTTSSTKGKTVTGLSCTKSGISTNKGAKQRRKAAGNKLIPLQSEQQVQTEISNTVCNQRNLDYLPSQSFLPKGENGKEFSGQGVQSPILSPSRAAPMSVLRQASFCSQKYKLQLFPIDEVTRRSLEMEKHNPYLELIVGTRKKISSVVKHLNTKWGKPQMSSGELTLFPYYARQENLISCRRWTLKDSGTTATDVHVAMGSPATLRLRYGWFSDIEPKISGMPLMSTLSENNLRYNEIETKITADCEKHSCPMESQEHGQVPGDDSSNQDVGKSTQLDKAVQPLDNQRTANGPALLWDLSNISFGALVSEASRNVNTSHITCDSFDAAIAHFKATIQSTPVAQSSILDAEETCNAFCFQKTTSSSGNVPSQAQDAPVASCVQNVSSNPLRLHDMLNSQAGQNVCQQSTPSPQLHKTSETGLQSRVDSQHLAQEVVREGHKSHTHTEALLSDTTTRNGKLDMYWPDSLGHLEYAAPSSKQFIGGDSMGLDGLIANSLDAFQNFSIF